MPTFHEYASTRDFNKRLLDQYGKYKVYLVDVNLGGPKGTRYTVGMTVYLLGDLRPHTIQSIEYEGVRMLYVLDDGNRYADSMLLDTIDQGAYAESLVAASQAAIKSIQNQAPVVNTLPVGQVAKFNAGDIVYYIGPSGLPYQAKVSLVILNTTMYYKLENGMTFAETDLLTVEEAQNLVSKMIASIQPPRRF